MITTRNFQDMAINKTKGFVVIIDGDDLDYIAKIAFPQSGRVVEVPMGFDDGGFWSADEIAKQGDDLPPHLKF